MERLKKSCLVVSYGPVPTPEYRTVEGGGMRAWGLAKGLAAQGIDTAVAVNNSFPQSRQTHEGIRLVNWGVDDQFINLMNSYDSVIVSYCMGSDSVFVADNISDYVQLILDVYVPIYVEVSARDSKDMDNEYRNYMADVERFNHVLRRGDYFLCASQSQKIFYTGVLGALGVVNPRSYRQDRILTVPFGIHNLPAKSSQNPYLPLGIPEKDFTVLWFGGLYPWFRVEELMDAIKKLAGSKTIKFAIVGGKNPFNPNPDFARQYQKVYDFASKNELIGKTVFFVDWVDFEDRINWYQHADAVISLNQPGEENMFSWRTRVMDFVWGEVPIITNGGDPLSEQLIGAGAALRLPELSGAAIVKSIQSLADDPRRLKDIKASIKKLKPGFYWDEITKPLIKIIDESAKPYLEEQVYRKHLSLDSLGNKLAAPLKKRRVGRAIGFARREGMYKSLKLAKDLAGQRLAAPARGSRRYVFISHPIDNSGAPLVLMQMLGEFAEKFGPQKIRVVAPHIDAPHLRSLRERGIKVDIAHAGPSNKVIGSQLGLRKDDFVLINTLAVQPNYQDYVLDALRKGQLRHAYWYIHEDESQLPSVNGRFLDKAWLAQLAPLVDSKRLSLLVPSERIRRQYNKLLGVSKVAVLPYRVEVPDKYKKLPPAKNFAKLDFVLAGTATDGRKGQMIAIAAFYDFIKTYYEKKPRAYRPFKLHLVAIGQDYVSQQIRTMGASMLGAKHFEAYPPLARADALKVFRNCNSVICCSLNETFAIYVAEAMFMGHVVLRNNSAGVDEQLKDGVNGYYIDSGDIHQFAAAIEKLLNKSTSSDAGLQKMGKASQEIIETYANNNYAEKLT